MNPPEALLHLIQDPTAAGAVAVDEQFRSLYRSNIDWLLDRLSKSTAGVRGLIAAAPTASEVDLISAEREAQLTPGLVALIAQAYACFLQEKSRAEGRSPAAFVGFDARFLSPEYAQIFCRVFAGNGVRVLRQTNGAGVPTPVSSFMAIYHGLDGSIMITASHNPPNHNGIKSGTDYGGVDTDAVSDLIAQHVNQLVQRGGEIRLAAMPHLLIEEVDALGIYARTYLRATFPDASLAALRTAIEGGAGFLFDGLHGVGGAAMRRYLDELLPGFDWARGIRILNGDPDPRIGGITKPDPSDPETLVRSGAVAELARDTRTLLSVTADMDADRIGTAVVIPEDQVERARKFGLFVSSFEGGVHIVRFTPNQIFTLIAYDRLLAASGSSCCAAAREHVPVGQEGGRFHLITTIATSVLAQQLCSSRGLQLHLTAVGFKNLGLAALEIDRTRRGQVILTLMEESGGAQIGPFHPWSDGGDTVHRDKDTCCLALALFRLAAELQTAGRGLLDFYLEMAESFGSLAYFERLDAYLPDRLTAETPATADRANAVKMKLLNRLVRLVEPAGHQRLLELFGWDAATSVREAPRELSEVRLLVKSEGGWREIHPVAFSYRNPAGERLEFYRAGPQPHDGVRFTVYRPDGRVDRWALVRASGTEAVVRAYLEIVEPLANPKPHRLVDVWHPLLLELGLHEYRPQADQPDYLTSFRRAIDEKYAQIGA